MTVGSITSSASGISRTLDNQNTRVNKSLASLASQSRFDAASVDVSGLAVATSLQTQSSTLLATGQNLAQAGALTDTAEAGAEQINDGLMRLSQLATEAGSGTLSDDEHTSLNTEFQSVVQEINTIANTTSFNGQPLLNGSLNISAGGTGTPNLSIGDLTTNTLFNGATPDVLTADNAQAALATIASAQSTVSTTLSSIASTSENLQFSAASIGTALQNQEASTSTLSDEDFGASVTESTSASVQFQAGIAAAVQTNRLHQNILDVLKE